MPKTMRAKELELISKDDKYYLKAGKDLLKTPNGNVIESKSKTLLENIIADFEGQKDLVVENGIILEPRILSAYVLASSKRDFMDEGDNLEQFPAWLAADPVFESTAGHPKVAVFQEEQRQVVRDFLEEQGLPFKEWDKMTNQERGEVFRVFYKAAFDLTAAQKSALVNLSWPNSGQFVMTIMFLLGRCNEKEWARAIFSRTPDVCRIVGEIPMGAFLSAPDDLTDEDREQEIESMLKGYEEECLIAKRYLEATRDDN